MNDRFRFRVWIKQSNSYIKEKMFFIDRFGGLFKYEKSKSTVYINADSPYIMCLCGDRYVCEQCTGLKDKNGKLIYEGDIVREISKKEPEYEEYITAVEWNNCGFNLYREDEYDFLIIGNIHENADLLEVNND